MTALQNTLSLKEQQSFYTTISATLTNYAHASSWKKSTRLHDLFKKHMREQEEAENQLLSDQFSGVAVSIESRKTVQIEEVELLAKLTATCDPPFFPIDTNGNFAPRWFEKIIRTPQEKGAPIPSLTNKKVQKNHSSKTDLELFLLYLPPYALKLPKEVAYATAVMEFLMTNCNQEDLDHNSKLLRSLATVAKAIRAVTLVQTTIYYKKMPEGQIEIMTELGKTKYAIEMLNSSKKNPTRLSQDSLVHPHKNELDNTSSRRFMQQSTIGFEKFMERRPRTPTPDLAEHDYDHFKNILVTYPHTFKTFLETSTTLKLLVEKLSPEGSIFSSQLSLIIEIASSLAFQDETFVAPDLSNIGNIPGVDLLDSNVFNGFKKAIKVLTAKQQYLFFRLSEHVLVSYLRSKGNRQIRNHVWNKKRDEEKEENASLINVDHVPPLERKQIHHELSLTETLLGIEMEPYTLRQADGSLTENRWLEALLRDAAYRDFGLTVKEIKKFREMLIKLTDDEILAMHLGFGGQNKGALGIYAAFVISELSDTVKNSLRKLQITPSETGRIDPQELKKIPEELIEILILHYLIEVFANLQQILNSQVKTFFRMEMYYYHNTIAPPAYDFTALDPAELTEKLRALKGTAQIKKWGSNAPQIIGPGVEALTPLQALEKL